jgi:CarD family transcriptional regulator
LPEKQQVAGTAKDKMTMKKQTKKAAPAKKAAAGKKPAHKAKPAAKTAPKAKPKVLVKAKAQAHRAPAKAQAPVKKPIPAATAKSAAQAHKPAAQASQPATIKPAAVKAVAPKAAMPKAMAPKAAPPKAAAPAPAAVAAKPAAPAPVKLNFRVGELIVYPAHGVGRVTAIEEQEIAGARLELYIVDFEREKLRLKVPTNRAEQKGMRRLADRGLIEHAMKVIRGRARIQRTMWSRRAQEYDAKINSGDLIAVAEVVRDLYRSDRQPEQSYSERQLFEQALFRMARELAAVRKIDDDQSVKELSEFLSKNAKRVASAEKPEEEPASTEEAA